MAKSLVPTSKALQLATDLAALASSSGPHYWPETERHLLNQAAQVLAYIAGERDVFERQLQTVRSEAFAEGVDDGWDEALAAVDRGHAVNQLRRPTTHGRAVAALETEVKRLEDDPSPDHVTIALVGAYAAAAEFLSSLSPEGAVDGP